MMRICNTPGCPNILPCDTHPKQHRGGWAPDSIRGTPSQRGYGATWRKLRAQILKRDNRTCTLCDAPGNTVDHIVPKSQGGTDHPDNLATLCSPCHTTKTQGEAIRARQARRH